VVAQWQLQRAGVPRHRIAYQLRKRWLESIYRGIYQVGPIAPPRHREMAAVLACGVGAVLSHQSAGGLWDLIPLPPATAPVTVSTTRDLRGRGSGLRLYSVASLREDEVTHLDALPLTTPTRTLLDLAGTLSTRELEQALARADRQRLLDLIQIEALLARHPRRRGNARLRALLAAPNAPALTRSEAEERFLALVRKAGLRHPETNVAIRGFEVDALWRAERLVVEIDGFAFHSAPAAFERDRQRDGVLTAAGLRVLRITWSQLTREPEVVLVRLAQALTARGAPP
jgi:very-short-patch-repair endonuclease